MLLSPYEKEKKNKTLMALGIDVMLSIPSIFGI